MTTKRVKAAALAFRVASVVFVVLTIAITVSGCVAIQVDPQYGANGPIARLFVGLGAGLFGAALYSPLILIASIVVGCGATIVLEHRRRGV